MTNTQVAVQECRGHFWTTMRNAVTQAGGHPSLVDNMADMPLSEVVDMLAQNGLRMVYATQFHIDSILKSNVDSSN